MNALLAILSPLALLLPAVAGELPAARGGAVAHEAAARADLPKGFDARPGAPFDVFQQARRPQEFGQVRIEERGRRNPEEPPGASAALRSTCEGRKLTNRDSDRPSLPDGRGPRSFRGPPPSWGDGLLLLLA